MQHLVGGVAALHAACTTSLTKTVRFALQKDALHAKEQTQSSVSPINGVKGGDRCKHRQW